MTRRRRGWSDEPGRRRILHAQADAHNAPKRTPPHACGDSVPHVQRAEAAKGLLPWPLPPVPTHPRPAGGPAGPSPPPPPPAPSSYRLGALGERRPALRCQWHSVRREARGRRCVFRCVQRAMKTRSALPARTYARQEAAEGGSAADACGEWLGHEGGGVQGTGRGAGPPRLRPGRALARVSAGLAALPCPRPGPAHSHTIQRGPPGLLPPDSARPSLLGQPGSPVHLPLGPASRWRKFKFRRGIRPGERATPQTPPAAAAVGRLWRPICRTRSRLRS